MTQLIDQVVGESPTGARAVKELSAAVGVSRASYYRQRQPAAASLRSSSAETQRRQAIERIALEMPSYGHRPMTAELQRRGLTTGRDRVLRYMREDNLLCRPRRAFVATTDSNHPLEVFPNLARELLVTDIDQLWVADITYIRLLREFVYLAVLLDAFSRRVIGWALKRHLMTELTLSALQMALASRRVKPGLMHHSDKGKQYAAAEYVSLLIKHQIQISMSRTGNPYDNAKAERFMRTVKYEEVYLSDYQTLTEARVSISHFIEEVYNRKRLHSALGYRPPVEFEQLFSQPILA
jgi:transposase InsO family protein